LLIKTLHYNAVWGGLAIGVFAMAAIGAAAVSDRARFAEHGAGF
jgi:hypothetical protein